MVQWTVDTCVLVKCTDTNDMDCIVCSVFLGSIESRGKICLDLEGEIEHEYAPYIKSNPWLSMWWRLISRQVGHISYRSNKLFNRHKRHLLERMDFHDDDIKFVGVASRSDDKIIVSGWDSDYCQEVCDYLKDEVGIVVVNPHKALEM